jgi:hypothetical protein
MKYIITLLLTVCILTSPFTPHPSHAATPLLVDTGVGIIADTANNLFWLKNANCFGEQNWDNAILSSNNLASGQCGLSDGSRAGDWHLPLFEELTIFAGARLIYTHLNAAGFLSVQPYIYWTGSTYVDLTGDKAWIVNMYGANVGYDNKSGNYDVWPVRSGLILNTTTLPEGRVGTYYSTTLSAIGGAWSIAAGTLPQGVTLDSARGVIAGTPANSGVFSFTVKLTDAVSPGSEALQAITLTIAKADQTITFPSISPKTYGNADFGPGATTTSSLPITYSSDTPSVATITAAGLIHITGTGSAVITASQIGNSNYKPATATQTLTVNKAVLTVTANDISTSAGAVSSLTFTTGYSGFVLGETSTVITGTPAITTTATDSSPTGSYPITPAIGSLAAANYSFNYANGTLAVGLTTQSISFNPLPDKTYGTATIDLTPYITGGASGNPLTFAVTSGPGSITGSTLTVTGVGEIVVTVSQAGNNYYASATAQQAMKINPAIITVTAANATRQTGDANPAFTATYSGFVNGETAATALTGSALLTTTATTASQQGSYPISAVIGTLTAANYTFTFVNAYLAVGLSSQSITFDSIVAHTYGDASFTLSATASSTLPVTYNSSNTAVATVSGTTVTIVGAGTTQIIATQTGNNFYAAAIAEQTVTVNPATLIVTAANTTRSYATANPEFTATYSGFVNGDTKTVLFGTPAFSCSATLASPVGSYPITVTANNLTAANYTITFAPGILDITKATAPLTNDIIAPTLTVSTLANNATTNNSILNITGTAKDTDSGIKSLTVNGQTTAVAADGTFSTAVTLATGTNIITTIATDNANNQTTDTRTITLDTTATTQTTLKAGWNLMGWTTTQGYYQGTAPQSTEQASSAKMNNISMATVFSTLGLSSTDSFVVVGPDGVVYMPGSPFNTLKKALPGKAYWIYTPSDKTITVPGTALLPTDQLPLSSGWTQIAYWGTEGVAPAIGFACINGKYDILVDETGKVYMSGSPFNTLKTLQKNKGYFIHTTVPATLVYQCQ